METESCGGAVRSIITVDAGRCLGCGQCLRSCALGALHVQGGIVRLVHDSWCRGLGACLGHCSADALSLAWQPAAAFDASHAAK